VSAASRLGRSAKQRSVVRVVLSVCPDWLHNHHTAHRLPMYLAVIREFAFFIELQRTRHAAPR
jgi:hypothetical protein